MNSIGKAFREWWPIGRWIIVGIVTVTLAYGKLAWDVENLKDADDRALMQRIEAIEKRTDDDAFSDWVGWRATTDAKIVGIEVDVRDLQRR